MTKYIIIVLSIISCIFIFTTVILGFAVKSLYAQNQTGKIYYRDVKKEKHVERKINEKYEKLDQYLKDSDYKRFVKLLNDNQNYIFAEKEDKTEKSDFGGKKNYPIYIDKMPEFEIIRDEDILVILEYRKYIELLQNRIIHNANYILHE